MKISDSTWLEVSYRLDSTWLELSHWLDSTRLDQFWKWLDLTWTRARCDSTWLVTRLFDDSLQLCQFGHAIQIFLCSYTAKIVDFLGKQWFESCIPWPNCCVCYANVCMCGVILFLNILLVLLHISCAFGVVFAVGVHSTHWTNHHIKCSYIISWHGTCLGGSYYNTSKNQKRIQLV